MGPSVPLCGRRYQLSETCFCLRVSQPGEEADADRIVTPALNAHVVGVTAGTLVREVMREGGDRAGQPSSDREGFWE